MPLLHVYSREGCHLCEVLLDELRPLVAGMAQIEVRDIDASPQWHDRYFLDIPVVEFDGQLVCRHFLDRDAVSDLLQRLSDTP